MHCGLCSAEGVVKRLLVVAGAALLMAACSEAPTAPPVPKKSLSPSAARFDEATCRSGYIVAYDENGNPYCAPADGDAGDLTRASNAASMSGPAGAASTTGLPSSSTPQ